jgi:hemolysin activation/secretion protein
MLRKKWSDKLLYVVAAVTLIPNIAAGNKLSIPDPGQQLLDEYQLQKEQQELLRPPANLLPEITHPVIKQQAKEECFIINNIIIIGTKLLSTNEQQKLFKPYLNQCLTGAQINQLLIDVNGWFVTHGYITTRVYLKQQNINSGILELTIIEGKLEDLKINEQNANLKSNAKLYTAFPSVKGKIFNIRDIEQGLDQMNRLSSQSATVKLIPGSIAGTSRVEVDNVITNPYRVYASFDNKGEEITGKYRASLVLEADNLLDFNDHLSLNVADTKNSRAYSWHFNLPYGYSTFAYSGSYSNYNTKIKEQVGTIGSGRNHDFSYEKLFYRDSNHKLSAFASLALKSSERYITFEEIKIKTTPQPLTVAKFGLSHFYLGSNYVLASKFAITSGIKAFGAARDTKLLNKGDIHNQFLKYSASVNLYKPLTDSFTYSTVLHAQYSHVGLQNSETLAITDSNYARGASRLGVNADDGLVVRNDLSFTLPAKLISKLPLQILKPSLKPYLLLDAGLGKAKSEKHYHKIVTIGAGVYFQISKLAGGISIAKPIYKNVSKKDGLEIFFNTSLKLY